MQMESSARSSSNINVEIEFCQVTCVQMLIQGPFWSCYLIEGQEASLRMSSPIQVLIRGFLNAIQIHRTILFILASRITAIKIFYCFLLNGFVFLGSMLAFEYYFQPFLQTTSEIFKAKHIEALTLNNVAKETIVDFTDMEWEWGSYSMIISWYAH